MDYYVLSNGRSFAAFYNSGAVYQAENVADAQPFSSVKSANECLQEELKYLQGFKVYQVSITPV